MSLRKVNVLTIPATANPIKTKGSLSFSLRRPPTLPAAAPIILNLVPFFKANAPSSLNSLLMSDNSSPITSPIKGIFLNPSRSFPVNPDALSICSA